MTLKAFRSSIGLGSMEGLLPMPSIDAEGCPKINQGYPTRRSAQDIIRFNVEVCYSLPMDFDQGRRKLKQQMKGSIISGKSPWYAFVENKMLGRYAVDIVHYIKSLSILGHSQMIHLGNGTMSQILEYVVLVKYELGIPLGMSNLHDA